jgi:hypothetical protein
MRSYQDYKIPTDWMLDSGMTSKVCSVAHILFLGILLCICLLAVIESGKFGSYITVCGHSLFSYCYSIYLSYILIWRIE